MNDVPVAVGIVLLGTLLQFSSVVPASSLVATFLPMSPFTGSKVVEYTEHVLSDATSTATLSPAVFHIQDNPKPETSLVASFLLSPRPTVIKSAFFILVALSSSHDPLFAASLESPLTNALRLSHQPPQ